MNIRPINPIQTPSAADRSQAPQDETKAPTFSRRMAPPEDPNSMDGARRRGQGMQPNPARGVPQAGHRLALDPRPKINAKIPAPISSQIREPTAKEAIKESQLRNLGNEIVNWMTEKDDVRFSSSVSHRNSAVTRRSDGVVVITQEDKLDAMMFKRGPDGALHVLWKNDRGEMIQGRHLRGLDLVRAHTLAKAACEAVRADHMQPRAAALARIFGAGAR